MVCDVSAAQMADTLDFQKRGKPEAHSVTWISGSRNYFYESFKKKMKAHAPEKLIISEYQGVHSLQNSLH